MENRLGPWDLEGEPHDGWNSKEGPIPKGTVERPTITLPPTKLSSQVKIDGVGPVENTRPDSRDIPPKRVSGDIGVGPRDGPYILLRYVREGPRGRLLRPLDGLSGTITWNPMELPVLDQDYSMGTNRGRPW